MRQLKNKALQPATDPDKKENQAQRLRRKDQTETNDQEAAEDAK